MTKPIILNAAELPEWTHGELKAHFTVLDLPKQPAEAAAFLREHGRSIRGIALRKTKIDQAFLDAVPELEVISSYSAGLDNVDVAAVKARGIKIENTSHILADDVANLALLLALAVTREIVEADAFVRAGSWSAKTAFPLGRSLSKMKVGVVGLGAIGSGIAKRIEALGSKVAYFGPNRKAVNWPYFDDVASLAAESDMLILACPLSAETHHLVDARVIEALGPRGYIVNIARGPVIDEAALVAALAADQLAGAALDVFEHEPSVPESFIKDRRLILAPHIASGTEETRQAMAENVVDALARHFNIDGPRPNH